MISTSTKRVIQISLPLITLLAFAIGWRQPRGETLQQVEPPKLQKLEFTGPEEGWPPRPKGQTNIKEVVSQEIPGSLTDAMEESLRVTAIQDGRVRKLLGGRFAYIGADEIELDKEKPRQPSDPLLTQLTFFSYTNNTAIEVRMKGTLVESAAVQSEYQPPESGEEVELAVTLAREDDRLRGKLDGLVEVNGILVEPPKGSPGFGHRVIEVFFGKKGEDLPDYHALVDMNTAKVLVANPLRVK